MAARAEDTEIYAQYEHEQVPAASTIKLAVLLACLRAVESGSLDLDQPLRIPPRRAGGAGSLRFTPSVDVLSLRELLALMVSLSDNTATNVVVELLGMSAVNRAAAEAGAAHTVMRRMLADAHAVTMGRDNMTTAADQLRLLRALGWPGPGLSARSTELARDLLASQQFNDRLPELLDPEWTVLHKTGELPGIRHDVGIVVLPSGEELEIAVLGTDLSHRDAYTAGHVTASVVRQIVATRA